MQSQEITLSKLSLIIGNIRTPDSQINNDVISESLKKDLDKTTFDISNKTYDISLTYHGQHSWILDLIRQQVSVYQKLNIVNNKVWANIESFNEISVMRNNLNIKDIQNQPTHTLIYILKAGENSGELILTYKKPDQKTYVDTCHVQQGNFYLFDSNIDYYFSKNLDSIDREYLTWTCVKQ
tara:strand:- start:3268 stop:3810 length:543 start_codon:yes stop_codon:yes gene_type:complete